ncbi:uncharacterized protein LOC126842114 [Adelges cooleyi]|uniref:uncharacterized protein LOC126842114 n=1 Tax=Adelges cooleyi TaxID=133065 RepID=UPI00217FE988|nr:uncharacterized protein LOC126842114 [Adelges cooleyi]
MVKMNSFALLATMVFLLCLFPGDGEAVRPMKLSRVYALTKNIPYAVTSADIYNYTISTVNEEPFVKITLLVTGAGFRNGIKLRTTSILKQRGSECYRNQKLKYVDAENHMFEQMWANTTHAYVSIKLQVDKSVFEGEVFLCVNGPRWINATSPQGRWIHQGTFGWLVWPEHPMIVFTRNSIDLRDRPKRASGTEPPSANQTTTTTFFTTTSGHGNKHQLSTNKISFLDETVWFNKTIKDLTAFVTTNGLRCKFLVGGVKKSNGTEQYANSMLSDEYTDVPGKMVYFCVNQ